MPIRHIATKKSCIVRRETTQPYTVKAIQREKGREREASYCRQDCFRRMQRTVRVSMRWAKKAIDTIMQMSYPFHSSDVTIATFLFPYARMCRFHFAKSSPLLSFSPTASPTLHGTMKLPNYRPYEWLSKCNGSTAVIKVILMEARFLSISFQRGYL